MKVTEEMVIDGSVKHKFDHTEAATSITKVRKPKPSHVPNLHLPPRAFLLHSNKREYV